MYKDLELLEFWFCSGGIADKYGMFLQNTKMNVLILIFERPLTTLFYKNFTSNEAEEREGLREEGREGLGVGAGVDHGDDLGVVFIILGTQPREGLNFFMIFNYADNC